MAKEYNIPPSDVDKLPYYEYEWYIEDINENQEKLKKQQEEEQKGMPNANDYKPGNYKMPNYSMPNYSMPHI